MSSYPETPGGTVESTAVQLIVAAKSRLGDWEGDILVGIRHQGRILTHVEHKIRFAIIAKLSRPMAQTTHRVTVYRQHAHVFSPTPYNVWERRVNENMNGLIRDFFPKGRDFSTIHPATVVKMERLRNQCPPKSLDFQTPDELIHALAKRR